MIWFKLCFVDVGELFLLHQGFCEVSFCEYENCEIQFGLDA